MGVDIYGRDAKSEDGEYFQHCWWSWRPILDAMWRTGLISEELYGQMGWNDGYGIETQEECDEMADYLEFWVKDLEDQDIIRIGDFAIESEKEEIQANVAEMCKGEDIYGVTVSDLRGWITFLRNCGGFEVL